MEQQFNHAEEIRKMVSVMPEQMKTAFQKVVMAGKKVLYAPESAEMIDQIMQSEAEISEKLGSGVANLVITLDNQANGAIPKDVIIPAATVLLFDAADMLKQAGTQISAEEIGKAYEIMFYDIFAGYGMPSDQVDDAFGRMEAEYGEKKPSGMLAQGE